MKYFKLIKYVVIFLLCLITLFFVIFTKKGEVVAKSNNPNTKQYFIYITDNKDVFEKEVNYETWFNTHVGEDYRTSVIRKFSKVDSEKWKRIIAPELLIVEALETKGK